MPEAIALDRITRRYTDQSYRHAQVLSHKGVPVAFALTDTRQIHYAVLQQDDTSAAATEFDADSWPDNPSPLQFPTEIEQVGFAILPVTNIPLVRMDTRLEADPASLREDEVDPFLSTTARLTADAPFRVFSDNKHIFLFRQSISATHEDAVYKLANGGSSAAETRLPKEYVLHNRQKVPLVNDVLLCDRFVLSGRELRPVRDVRFQRSRHRTKPAGQRDSLAARDMQGRPFFAPTLELAFASHLTGGIFDVLQLPTQVSELKRWQIFALNAQTGRVDSFNLEVDADGTFNPAGTQLYTSPDEDFRSAVLEREPGTCPFTGAALVPVHVASSHSESALLIPAEGTCARAEIAPWQTEAFTLELWAHASKDVSDGCAVFSVLQPDGSLAVELGCDGKEYVLRHAGKSVGMGEIFEAWQHLAVTYDGATLRAYVDGIVQGAVESSADFQFATYLFGCNASQSLSFHGSLEEVRVWERALLSGDIASQNSRSLVGSEPGLKAYWRLDEGTGSVAYDQTGSASHATLSGKTTWIASELNLADNPGIRRSSLSIQNHHVAGGLSAQLYFQQETVASGYDGTAKPMKKQARVLLACGTTGEDGKEAVGLATLDIAVSRQGRLARIPDALDLPELSVPESSRNIEAVQALEANIRSMSQDIADLRERQTRLQAELQTMPEIQSTLSEAKNDANTAADNLKVAEKDFRNYWCEIMFFSNRGERSYLFRDDENYYQNGSKKDLFQFIQAPSTANRTYYLKRKDGGYMQNTVYKNKWKVQRDTSNRSSAQLWEIRKSNLYSLVLKRDGKSYYLSATKGRSYTTIDLNHSNRIRTGELINRLSFLKRTPCNDVVENMKQDLVHKNSRVQAVQTELDVLNQRQQELDSLTATISRKQVTLDNAVIQLGEMSAGTLAPLSVQSGQTFSDVSGLTISGGLLGFAKSMDTPRVFQSAVGHVSVYFRDADGKLAATYYNTSVSRVRFTFDNAPSGFYLESRAAGGILNSSILSVTDGAGQGKCQLEFVDEENGLREIWEDLPRRTDELSGVINGTAERGGGVRVTAEPLTRSVKTSSSVFTAVSGDQVGMLSNGEAHVVPGKGSSWIADAPGRTFFFQRRARMLSASLRTVSKTAAGDMFTLELWFNASNTVADSTISRLLHHVSENSGYTLGLEKVERGTSDAEEFHIFAGVSNGSQEGHEGEKFLRSTGTIKENEWNHIAMVRRNSFGLEFDTLRYMSCGNSSVLDITGNFTAELFLQVNNFEQPHGLLGKGRLDDEDKRVPYQLRISEAGKLQFAFEKENGELEIFSSTTSLEAQRFYKIGITRRTGSTQTQTSGTQNVSYTDANGDQQSISVDTVAAVESEDFFEVSIYIDGELSGQRQFNERPPLGHDDDCEVGRCFISPSEMMYTRGVISEVRLWNVARSASDICAAIRGQEPGLIGWWSLEDREGNVAADRKSGNHGKLFGPQWVRSPDPDAGWFRLFKNGVPMEADVLPADHTVRASGWGDVSFSLAGSLRNGSERDLFRGMLEEVRLWKIIRSEEQILDNLFSRLKGEKQDLIAYYTFDHDSTAEMSEFLYDNGLLGTHLALPDVRNERPISMLSTAPVGSEIPAIQSALAGVKHQFHEAADCATSVCEYADMQRDLSGNLSGVLKRCYTYSQNGQWVLVTGYKAGNLVTEWIGQAQFHPTIKGYVEGAPPVPSENLTAGVVTSADNASVIEVVESESVSYSVGVTKNDSSDVAFEGGASKELGTTDYLVTAPMGIGTMKPVVKFQLNLKQKAKFNVSSGWSQDDNQGKGANQSQSITVATGGGFESHDHQLNPAVGRRAVPANSGFALVRSDTADVFALRLAHNNALVSLRMVPNPDIPTDWNLIPFPINGKYTKQGTLDGRVGYDENGAIMMDPDYPNARTNGEYSYFKPREAYSLERKIRREEQTHRSFYEGFDTGYGSSVRNAIVQAAGGAAFAMGPAIGAAAAEGMRRSVTDSVLEESEFPNEAVEAKRNLVNTYIWTADGGFAALSTETSAVRTEVSAGTFNFTGSTLAGVDTEAKIFGVGFNVEYEASLGGAVSVTKTQSRDASQSFGMNVSVSVPGDLQKYERNESGLYKPVYDKDGGAVPGKGKVDAYRFKTFYLDSSSANFEDLFGKVIDPIWLAESDHPNAIALRQAQQVEQKPPCWRVFHRTTFVSRLLPDFADPAGAPLESAMMAENISSNWQLIQKLDPFVKDKTSSVVAFRNAARDAVSRYLPELTPHVPDIIEYLKLYYGILE